MRKFLLLAALSFFYAPWVGAEISQVPLNVSKNEPAMTMIVLGRDQKLYTAAYNDVSDLNGDARLDVRFEPSFNYVGLFDPDVCYSYVDAATANARFRPAALAVTSNNDPINPKHCSGGLWSGNYLNYLTASKMDVIRKVLYGGKRLIDDVDRTVLIRGFVPNDAHTWGKQYPSLTVLSEQPAEFNISLYAPFSAPSSGRHHLFASTNIVSEGNLNVDTPLLRVITDSSLQLFDWVTIEQPEAVGVCEEGGRNWNCNGNVVRDFVVKVEACTPVMLDGVETVLENVGENKPPVCKKYGDHYKPIGLLQEFGETGSIQFGLMTGSYRHNTEGGILRSNIRDFSNEVNPATGQINPVSTSDDSIVKSLDALRIAGIEGHLGWNSTISHLLYSNPLGNCGSEGVVPHIVDGECRDWGNPLGEIVFETLRYFSQHTAQRALSPTPAFVSQSGVNTDTSIGLSEPAWRNPFANANLMCANKFQLLISDPTPSYDMNQIPGSPFNVGAPTFQSLNMKAEADRIFANEHPSGPIQAYIGERSGHADDLAPTPKLIDSLGNIRGIAPNTPTKEGGFSSAALSLYARSDRSDLNVRTFAVSLPNDVPKITIKVDGKDVTLQPFGKSLQSLCGPWLSRYYIDQTQRFRPTNQIANFYIERDIGTSGSFVVNYEDQEQGSDFDMDTAVRYEWSVVGNRLRIDASVIGHLSCVEQHVGLAVDGTTNDGVHLLVTGFTRYDPDRQVYVERGIVEPQLDLFTSDAYLNLQPEQQRNQYVTIDPGVNERRLGYRSHVEFTVRETGSAATTLNDPLWYAAKYGAQLGNDLPDLDNAEQWSVNGNPRNYFLAQNPANLQTQLRAVMGDIERLSQQASLTSLAVSAGSFSDGLILYQASFNPQGWSGNIKAIRLDENGSSGSTLWDARNRINSQFRGTSWQDRNVVTWDPYLPDLYSRKGVPFAHTNIWDAAARESMSPLLFATMREGSTSEAYDRAQKLLDYVKGDTSQEGTGENDFRVRSDTFNNEANRTHFLLGDIVHSTPVYVGGAGMGYPDECPAISGGCGSSWPSSSANNYSSFIEAQQNRQPVIYFGANDGMLHAIEAEAGGGEEIFAYVPSVVLPNLKELANTRYAHRYFVDGPITVSDVFINNAWRTILVGTLGAGGQAVYAIDVTNPGQLGRNSIMWEFTDRDYTNLGSTFAKPQIVRLHNDRWAVVIGNGYGNEDLDARQGDGAAHLLVIDLISGELIKDIQVGDLASANGLSSPAAVDANGDFVVDYVYAGDLKGNLWKFDLTSNSPASWDVDNGATPMIATGLPITVLPAVVFHPGGGVMVIFGTGKFFETGDNEFTGQSDQYYYGVRDRLNGTKTAIAQSEISSELVTQSFDTVNGFRAATNHDVDGSSQQGWRIALKDSASANNAGERAWGDPVIMEDRVYFTTARPVDVSVSCNTASLRGGLFSLRTMDGKGLGSALVPDGVDYKTDGNVSCNGTNCSYAGKMLTDNALNPPSIVFSDRQDGGTDVQLLLPSTGEGVDSMGNRIRNTPISRKRTGELPGMGRQSWREVKENLMCK